MRTSSKYRWYVVGVFFLFMLLHQSDRLLIGPLTSDIMATFNITMTQMGAVSTGALIVGAVLYPVWGYAYDRFARAKLLALASFIWGATTWVSAIAPTFPLFMVTRASTGIDDSSYPGLFSLISDYFGPQMRGKIYGLLQLTSPLGYIIGMVLGLTLSGTLGWRGVFYLTGGLGLVVAALIFFSVKETPRGQAEPEMEGLDETGIYRFDLKTALALFKKRSLVLLFIQGFFGVFPWNAITFWFFAYLQKERGYSDDAVLMTMVPVILILAAGYPLGGALGDWCFKRARWGRMAVSTVGVVAGAILMAAALSVPAANQMVFLLLLGLAAIFIPMASANVIATVFDVTLPEVRSTASAVESFIESIGAALSPLIIGIIADRMSLQSAFLIICSSAWALCAVFFVVTAYLVPADVEMLHQQMEARASLERERQTGLSKGTA
jgi:MFS transporter, Spinster family, sphingosine-1-phosphate transporter